MSLVAHALSICATGALAELLPPWVTVLLEPHEPVGSAERAQTILVAVFVGDEAVTPRGRRWSDAGQTVELVVQVILPPKIRATLNGAACEFDTHEGGTRALYALVHEALRRAFNEPGTGTWSALLQSVWVGHPEPLHCMPGKAERPGKSPIALIDFSIPCSTINPPPLGRPAPYPWPDISARMRADAAFTPDEADFFDALVAGTPLTDELAELALAGLSRPRGAALGLGPLADLDESPIPAALKVITPFGTIVETPDPS